MSKRDISINTHIYEKETYLLRHIWVSEVDSMCYKKHTNKTRNRFKDSRKHISINTHKSKKMYRHVKRDWSIHTYMGEWGRFNVLQGLVGMYMSKETYLFTHLSKETYQFTHLSKETYLFTHIRVCEVDSMSYKVCWHVYINRFITIWVYT